jgi:RHS repeat-associated protein
MQRKWALGADSYDDENRLVSASRPVGQITIAYDGDGNRVSKTVGTVTTKYLVDDRNPTGYAQVIEELTPVSGNLTPVRVYAYGHDLLYQDQPMGGTWTASYYGYDGHGSVRYLTDGGGNVTDTYDYDAFGVMIGQYALNPQTGQMEALTTANQGLATPNRYFYAGEQWDYDLNLYYNRARYLNPDTGRFWSMDIQLRSREGSQLLRGL